MTGIGPGPAAKVEVLAAYRELRRGNDRRPYWAMRAVVDRLALSIAVSTKNGTPIDRGKVEQFAAAFEYSSWIAARTTEQAELRGCQRFQTFWHRGRVGDQS